MKKAEDLSKDYFRLDQEQFMKQWMPGMAREVRRQTTSASWEKIVDDLGNKVQQDIVTDDRDRTNVLVLAGPGSGKTRVLVHRIAYLLRMKREDPRGILVLAYNRHAAAEIRMRLRGLVGDDANGITILTCHSLAMRLVGASFTGVHADKKDFDNIITEAVRLLNADDLSKSEAEAQRESLIQGYRWILVDEYQDIGAHEYDLISAVAGRSLEDADLKLSLFAVGDDDQNVYAFRGASIEFIRKFEDDYNAKPAFLIENYRSTANIIAAGNDVISRAPDRMKVEHSIRINKSRSASPAGGRLEKSDAVVQGRVHLLDVPPGDAPQAIAAIDELLRLSRLDPSWNWAKTAVISRDWKGLGAVRAYAESKGLTVQMANEEPLNIWRFRETQKLVTKLRQTPDALLGVQEILDVLNEQPRNRWVDLIAEGIAELAQELKTKTMPVADIIEWIAEWSKDVLDEQRNLLLLTAHRAKGLEFDHVVILNGGWDRIPDASHNEDHEAQRRLFYVAMTRARQSLTVLTSGKHQFLNADSKTVLHRSVQPDMGDFIPPRSIYQMSSLKAVDLSYAGRQRNGHSVHSAVPKVKVGDKLSLKFSDPHWLIINSQDQILGRMAKAWKMPAGHILVSGHVGAVVNWRKQDNEEEYRPNLKRDSWETVLPEFIFQPEGYSTRPVQRPNEIEVTDGAVTKGNINEEPVHRTPVETTDLEKDPLPKNTDQMLADAMKTIVKDAVSETKTWDEFAAALELENIKLRPKGGGLVVCDAKSDEEVCKLSLLKLSYINLIRHFGEGFPGHTATWLVERALDENYVPKGRKRGGVGRKKSRDDDFSVIED
ncbi:UvrD-helicase domain-containing protein [Microbulbifer sp. S227A]|uniref:UvrD-helicase domain-containing protein n=1 Tax=Microbulbifer sp. S227A TaxID=3415131 RepID=UPI003C7EB042